MAESLERSLSFGSSVKKPAGGVSLHFQGAGNESREPQTTIQKTSRQQVRETCLHILVSSITCLFLHFPYTNGHFVSQNEDDVDSDFSISSVDDMSTGPR